MENKKFQIKYVLASTCLIRNLKAASYNSKRLVPPYSPNQDSSEEPVAKKSRYNESIASSLNSEQDTQQVETLPYLPPEILQTILSNVSTSDLLNCRLVSHHWDDNASEVLKERDDYSVHFTLGERNFVHVIKPLHGKTCTMNMWGYEFGRNTLTDLVNFLRTSPHFPFTCFRFDSMSTDSLNFGSMTEFLTVWGSEIRWLKVSCPVYTRTLDILRISIFEKFPNLRMLTFLLALPRRKSKSFLREHEIKNELYMGKCTALCEQSTLKKFLC